MRGVLKALSSEAGVAEAIMPKVQEAVSKIINSSNSSFKRDLVEVGPLIKTVSTITRWETSELAVEDKVTIASKGSSSSSTLIIAIVRLSSPTNALVVMARLIRDRTSSRLTFQLPSMN